MLSPTVWALVITLSMSGRFQGEQECDFAHADVEALLGHPSNHLVNSWVVQSEYLELGTKSGVPGSLCITGSPMENDHPGKRGSPNPTYSRQGG